jgi:hypothetical protein
MIVVSVDLWPGGFAPLGRQLGMLRISNVSDLARVSNYSIHIAEAANPLSKTPARIGGCRIEAHDRKQSIWVLIERAAAAAQTADFVDF